MAVSNAELAVAGELERGKALFALSVAFTVVAGVVCVVCIARMGMAAGLAPPPSPPPPAPTLYLVLNDLTSWSIFASV